MRFLKYVTSIPRESIVRRYFLMNTFDGSLTILGIILALHFSGVQDPKVVIISCLGAAVAMCVSGLWGAYAVEKAERLRELKTLERHVLSDLDDTHIGRRLDRIVIQVALVDGLSPLTAAFVIITPYIASHLGLLSAAAAFKLALTIEAVILFSLGFLVGSISREDRMKNGVKMLAAGAVVAAVTLALEAAKVI